MQVIDKKREDLRKGIHGEFKSLTDMLMEISDSDPSFSEDDVINEACTFMLAVSNIFCLSSSVFLHKTFFRDKILLEQQ